MAGTLLPAMLVTGINSDLPGEILAQITRNVYDSQQRFLLIPRGTKVIGRYDDQVALGQSRVLIAWTRLILPDGRSLSLPGLPTKDLRGAAGLRDKVDNHYRRLYGQATLLSIVGAGAQLSQPQQSSVLTPPSAGQVAALAARRREVTTAAEPMATAPAPRARSPATSEPVTGRPPEPRDRVIPPTLVPGSLLAPPGDTPPECWSWAVATPAEPRTRATLAAPAATRRRARWERWVDRTAGLPQ